MSGKSKASRSSGENGKQIRLFLPCLAVLTAIMLFLFLREYTEQFRLTLRIETQGYLAEIAQQVTLIINDRVESNLKNLETDAVAVSRMQLTRTDDPEQIGEIAAFLREEAERYGYSSLCLADRDGFALTETGTTRNVSGHRHYLEALQGETGISGLVTLGFQNVDSIEFAVPVWVDGTVAAVLMANYSLIDFRDILSVKMFGNTGNARIIDSYGVNIVGGEEAENYNFLSALKDNPSISQGDYQQIASDIGDKKSGILNYIHNDREVLLYYQPLEINDWSLLITAPTDQISGKTNMLLKGQVYVGIFIAALVFSLMMVSINTQRTSRRKLEQMLFVDPVTEGDSYAKFELEARKRTNVKDQTYVLVQLNIEKFKLINTTFGRERGNTLLHFIYQSITACLEQDEIAARTNADRFCMLLRYRSQEEIMDRVRELIRRIHSFHIDSSQKKYVLRLNAGACIVTAPEVDISVYYERANFARTHGLTKQMTVGEVTFYSEVEQELILREKDLENRMEEALVQGEFQVYFQPKYELAGNTISGAEALIRWMMPGKGMLPPNEFIPLFERNGFIVKVDLYVFNQVCRLLQRRWDRGQRCVPISVNLSRKHLENLDFLREYEEIFSQYTFPAALLEIELTESIVFDNMHQLNQAIDRMHGIGFSCSMDDFGSGYSSLNLLKDIPVDTLKLDRAFFYSDSGEMEKSRYVIEAIIHLASKLQMKTVSEGVETAEQVEYLRLVKCDMVQGFIFAKPQPMEEFERLMEEEANAQRH